MAFERSYLFVPGDRPERFAKAFASGADRVILDLEDAVSPAAKALARAAILRWIRERDDNAMVGKHMPDHFLRQRIVDLKKLEAQCFASRKRFGFYRYLAAVHEFYVELRASRTSQKLCWKSLSGLRVWATL